MMYPSSAKDDVTFDLPTFPQKPAVFSFFINLCARTHFLFNDSRAPGSRDGARSPLRLVRPDMMVGGPGAA